MFGNQLHSFSNCGHKKIADKTTKRIKLVIQVEKGTVWLPKGMKVTNYPKVVISQPLNSLPLHLKQLLENKKEIDA